MALGAVLFVGLACGRDDGNRAIPHEEAVHRLNGADLFVRVIGSGEPIVVLHGGPGLDQSYFLPQMEGLAENHTLIFYDQRASGRSGSDLDSTDITLDLFIRDIDAVRAHYGLERMNLMGHSWGGFLAMLYAIQHPDRLNSLILVSPSPASSAMRNEESQMLASRLTKEDQAERDSIIQSTGFQNGDPAAYEGFFRVFFRSEFFNPERIDELTLVLPENFITNSRLLQYLARDLAVYDIHAALESVEAPALVVNGESESGLGSGRRISEHLPSAQHVVLEECGHFPFVEKPAAFFEAVNEFLASH
ncbi:MAG: alpha/beta fold hydrolase [Gemmatimonadetes bacterium]|nr:alpha/beta fold hydrolase [Gemmatimonadota bacterium]